MVVNKPAGMASVPGREVSSSVADEASDPALFVVHRLDMHTSGVLLLAKDEKVFKELQSQFTGRSVRKCYVAVLEGEVHPQSCGNGVHWESAVSGIISLPLAADYDHRPAQKVDFETGKEAVTRFEITAIKNGRTYINFYPVTGRTHQLRVHSAHQMGLNAPIVGDLIYGKAEQRLMLHAHWVEFQHPLKGDFKIVSPLPDGFSL